MPSGEKRKEKRSGHSSEENAQCRKSLLVNGVDLVETNMVKFEIGYVRPPSFH